MQAYWTDSLPNFLRRSGAARRAINRANAVWCRARTHWPSVINMRVLGAPTHATEQIESLASQNGWRLRELGSSPPRLPSPIEGCCEETLRMLTGELWSIARPFGRFCVELPSGFVQGIRCGVVSAEGAVLSPCCPHRGVPASMHRALVDMPIALRRSRLRGRSAVIGSVGPRNFYHWMVDVLPRIGLTREGREPERWITAPLSFPHATEMLARCGVPMERVRPIRRGELLRCDTLVAPSAPAYPLEATDFVVDFLRANLRPKAQARGRSRRIYILRPERRRVANERRLLERLGAIGFEAVDLATLGLDDQARALGGAEIVVAPHGAGLANLVHCPEGASVIEFIPPDLPGACFLCLAGACGLRYACLPGHRVEPALSQRRDADPTHHDFCVDVDRVLAVVAAALRSAP